jgi:hypothetical protein
LLVGVEPYFNISGLFGNPDEIEKSGLEELSKVEDADLREGRRFYQVILGIYELAAKILDPSAAGGWKEGHEAFQAAAISLKETDECAVTFLAWGTLAAYRHRTVKQ